ncbi:MAG: aminotransferase class I/II-fold pyridoxal phosphate-dependent enzyme [Acidobacteria bacterium]|nr:aminotransferase class I/II-fold pyridoxal phosphate-dependent enzyme [Acidobacteriota bacterium]
MIIDLRSDTLTQPTEAMRRAMAEARVGDDVYGEDPTLNTLQERAAELMGKEASLFFPTGSMGNLAALLCHTTPGSEVIVEASSHIYNYELASLALVGGLLPRVVPGTRGRMDPAAIREAVPEKVYYRSPASLVCVENTHNLAGGAVLDLAYLDAVRETADALGLPVHLDGARIFNAAVSLGVGAADIARRADSVMFCLSKGLCAPVGSLLAGSRDLVEHARVHRKRLGGGMRQAGVLAAAGLVALETLPPLLAQDHEKVRRIADFLSRYDFIRFDPETVKTNILVFEVRHPRRTSRDLADQLREHGVRCGTFGERIRFVTYRDIDTAQIDRLLEILADLFRSRF